MKKLILKLREKRLESLETSLKIANSNYEWYNESYEQLIDCILDNFISSKMRKECEKTAKMYRKDLDRLEKKMRRLIVKIGKVKAKINEGRPKIEDTHKVGISDDEPMRHFED